MRDKLGDKKMLEKLDSQDRENAMNANELLEQLPSEEVRKQQRLAMQMTDEKNNALAGQPQKAPEKMGDQNVSTLIASGSSRPTCPQLMASKDAV